MDEHDIKHAERLNLSDEARGIYDRIYQSVRQRSRSQVWDVSYGACPRGGDPRDYYPDLEVCTAEEVARWVQAVQLWDNGDRHPEGPMPASWLCTRDESFGVGVLAWKE